MKQNKNYSSLYIPTSEPKLVFTAAYSSESTTDLFHGIAFGKSSDLSHPEFDVLLRTKDAFSGTRYSSRVNHHMNVCYLNIYAKFCIKGKLYFTHKNAVEQISFIRDDTVAAAETQDKYVAIPPLDEFKPIYDKFLSYIRDKGSKIIDPCPKQGDLVIYFGSDTLQLEWLLDAINEARKSLDVSQYPLEDTLDTLESMVHWVAAPSGISDPDIERALVCAFDTTISHDHFR